MPNKIQLRRGSASAWAAANTLLSSGEAGFETDTNKLKIGNGSASWNQLGYVTQYDERQAEELLREAVWWIDAAHAGPGQTVPNLGWGGDQLDARVGSSTAVDSNDPKYLDWDGENYVYLPGVAANYLSVPDEAALDITGDIDIRVQVALDDWTPGATHTFVSKYDSGQYSFALLLNTVGQPQLRWSADGSTAASKTATAANSFTDGQSGWIRATLDVDNGSSGNDVKFYTSSDDGATWTQLGSTVTTAGTTSIYAGTAAVHFGSFLGTYITGKFYRAQILNGIDGTKVLDVDTSKITSGSDTSFTAVTGQTVTINRSTSGRKAVAVTSPLWLFGTDDYMGVADNDLLDFGASDSFTVLAVRRTWDASIIGSIIAKSNSLLSTTTGWALHDNSTFTTFRASPDGGVTSFVINGNKNVGSLSVAAGVRDTFNSIASILVNGSPLSTSDPTGDLSNGSLFYIGRVSAATPRYNDMEFIAGAIFRRALTPQEILTISNYYQTRSGYALPRSDKSLPIKSSGGIKYQLTIDDDGSLNTREL